ncbi:asparaginase [Saccharomonospora cyanea]|uniref:asparaginase n=1 Tax=Saccharomonospora cyanea NA-134 TaxID=882082 RepID=H5XI26_9PSEU|nr:asparaginase [Saccharomonospora cyanea]EHR60656.1 L-asparaginase/GlutRNAGln amidotransferase subunit D [Saccharomonospora cyanea NA-134]
MPKPAVAIIGTGGTVSGVAPSRTSFHRYEGGRLRIRDLTEELRDELTTLADVYPSEFRGASPPGLRLADYRELTLRVDALLTDVDAVVVTTGTQFLEELAYWLDLTVRSPKPVVVTGSMRPWNVLGSDAPANLYNAVSLAASARTTGFGTVVLFNDEIVAAREVTKTSTLRLHAFQARDHGRLGTVDGEHIRLPRAPARSADVGTDRWRTPFDVRELAGDRLPVVEIVLSYVEAGAATVDGPLDAGADGIVMAGEPSAAQLASIRRAVEHGVLVVAASRNGSGAVYRSGMPEIPAAEDLLPQKARMLLVLALGVGGDRARAHTLFETYRAP